MFVYARNEIRDIQCSDRTIIAYILKPLNTYCNSNDNKSNTVYTFDPSLL